MQSHAPVFPGLSHISETKYKRYKIIASIDSLGIIKHYYTLSVQYIIDRPEKNKYTF